MSKQAYAAHSANEVGQWHALVEHLTCVGKESRRFANGSPWADEAALAGLLHDLGKYADRFQERLKGQDHGLDHWSQGAWIALSSHRAVAAALAIQGHHIGLQRGALVSLRQMNLAVLEQQHPQRLQLSDPDSTRLLQRAA